MLHGHRPLSQRSFLWPKRLTAGGAGAKEASSGVVGPGEALGTLVTISGYVKRPRYARLNTPMGADGAISCMSCASYLFELIMSSLTARRSLTALAGAVKSWAARSVVTTDVVYEQMSARGQGGSNAVPLASWE